MREVISTGFKQKVDSQLFKIPDFDPRSGNHFWVMNMSYKVDPTKWEDPDNVPLFDLENLVAVAGPGCFYCEQLYSDRLAKRRCPGDPK